MCGIAGIINLAGPASIPRRTLAAMAGAVRHRGPDEEGFFIHDIAGFAARRLAIVGLEDGQQPVYNESLSVVAVFNGELFEYPELRHSLAQQGHVLRSHTDSELVVHLWEQYGEEMFPRLRGQFAFALLDIPQRRLILARDRTGICPLYWSRQGDRLIFASEIKALLASGLVRPEADPAGLDNVFTFFCMPGQRTAFKGVEALRPGHYLRIDMGDPNAPLLSDRLYWDFEFPDAGDEDPGGTTQSVVTAFDALLDNAIRRRLRADVPVAAYLSGGVDSSLVLARARQIAARRLTAFTARVGDPSLDESAVAQRTAAGLDCEHHTVDCDRGALVRLFPCVVAAAESPVVDPNAGSLHALSAAVHQSGYKTVLTGEGADEALAGYVWFKAHRLLRTLAPLIGKLYQHRYPRAPAGEFARINQLMGGLHAHTLVYHLTSIPKWRLLRDEFLRRIGADSAYDQLRFDAERIRRWHPLNRSLYMGYKIQLPGLLLNHRGDRASMANSVEGRYPFLDEDLIAFCARIHPRWKLRGIAGDKYLLRLVAGRHLPRTLARRRKAMFRAPFAATFLGGSTEYVRQLLSAESLKKTDYFSPPAVGDLLERIRQDRVPRPYRLFYEMSLCAVVGTQLWHHLFLSGNLCELTPWRPPDETQL